MIGYFVLFQIFATAAGKPRLHLDDDIFWEVVENDANLNPGFDLNGFRQNQLNLHNYYRAKHGVPMMTLDSTLNDQAQSYAEHLAKDNKGLNHCHSPSCNSARAGENLASAWGSTTTEMNATKAWYNEIWDYNFCTGGIRPGHEGKHVGHFTQVVWRTSTKLGIGNARTSDRKKVYVVGRYLAAGNFRGRYLANVLKPNYIFQTFQDNCDGIDGGLTDWSAPGQCSRSCGGGVQFKTKTCTNPKPSLNGRDCVGTTKQLVQEWCNTQSCSGTNSYRDEQCEARGYPAKSYDFGEEYDCKLYCFKSERTYMKTGNVDDGTHCSSHSGACVGGVCVDMPDYSASISTPAPPTPAPSTPAPSTPAPPTPAPPTPAPQTVAPASGPITGEYTGTPSSNFWKNKILTIPNGATNVAITNKKYNNARIMVGYQRSGAMGYSFSEASWMDSWVKYQGYYETTHTTKGVAYVYKRDKDMSTIKIAGPVQPTGGFSLVLFVRGSKPADISWSYTA